VARELRTGRLERVWLADDPPARPPYGTDPESLFVAYYASAELGCHLALGWPMPTRILDLYAEFRCLTSGLALPPGAGNQRHSLLCAMAHHGLDCLAAVEKGEMRELALRGGPYTPAERAALLAYCQSDVDALARLLPRMLPGVDLPRALLRGRSMAAAARMEWAGVPLDQEFLARLQRDWLAIKGRLIAEVDRDYGLFVPSGRRVHSLSRPGATIPKETGPYPDDQHQMTGAVEPHRSGQQAGEEKGAGLGAGQGGGPGPALVCPASVVDPSCPSGSWTPPGPLTFSASRWESYLARKGIPWPRTGGGALALDDDTFKEMARLYPAEVGPVREMLQLHRGHLRTIGLAVGADGRSRCLLSAFASCTGRFQPSNTRFIFGPACWLRGLIRPGPGWALAYIDWSAQEYGIAACLSGDPVMQADYQDDPYLGFGRRMGVVPSHATKQTHRQFRDQLKVACGLGAMYGAGPATLSRVLGISECQAREWLRAHREIYATYWRWSDAVLNQALLTGELRTVFGWRLRITRNTRPNTIRNWMMQSHGAEMLRLACCLTTEQGISVCAPIHDALLVEAPVGGIDDVVRRTREAMREASVAVLPGFPLRTDAKVVRYPDRYLDERGRQMWETAQRLLTDQGGA
jgi:hypothetical protein